MALISGARLGPYEIEAAVGAGGMGEVYRARDTRLDRTVAIKVLSSEFSGDADRRARFNREARTIAGLNHPHICTLYDVGEQPTTGQGQPAIYLVMELLQGETLAAHLERGPLPLDQAMNVATEIADALTAAHRQGVVHRDLKPGNVMLTATGAKLLDFGLAKLTGHGAEPISTHLASAATQSTPLTAEGSIVGTLQYMAPEQVEGKSADARADLWALGTIIYEMLTGRRAFEGKSAASLIGNIMNADPPALTSSQPLAPSALDWLVKRCLAKDPDQRAQSARDVADELRWMRQSSDMGQLRARRRGFRMALMTACILASVLVGASLMWLLGPGLPPPSVSRLSLDVRPAEELRSGGNSDGVVATPGGPRTALTWTPDGQALVFVGRRDGIQRLYIRRLDSAEARPLPNTDGAQVPAVSADGRWVAFWANNTIRKVPLAGGAAMDVAPGVTYPPWGMTWDSSGRVFFGRDDGRIWMAPAEGAPTAVTTVRETELRHSMPAPMPGGRVLLYTVRKRAWSWGDEEVVAETLATGARKVLFTDAVDARYVPTGHIVFLRRGQMLAVPFDADRLEVRGSPVVVQDPVAQSLTGPSGYDVTGAGQFAISETGNLAMLRDPAPPYEDAALVSVSRRGDVTPIKAPERSYGLGMRLSPDGGRLAVLIVSLTERGLWLYDMSRRTLTPLVRECEVHSPLWSADGQQIYFMRTVDGRRTLTSVSADGAAPPRDLVAGPVFPSSITPDGQRLVAVRQPTFDSVIFSFTRDQFLWPNPSSRVEGYPAFSPDGHWLVYVSGRSGRSEVYVRPYPGPGPETLVSVEGGDNPAWDPKGNELFFLSPQDSGGKQQMMAAGFRSGTPPQIDRPTPLFDFDNRLLGFRGFPIRGYEVALNPQGFIAAQRKTPPPLPPVTHITLIQNWFVELKALAPALR